MTNVKVAVELSRWERNDGADDGRGDERETHFDDVLLFGGDAMDCCERLCSMADEDRSRAPL